MNRIQLNHVRSSLDWFRPCGGALIAQTVRQLADNHPRVRSLLPEDTANWNVRWFATLEQIVGNLHSFESVEPGLGVLGRRATLNGFTPAHMATVRDELILAMARLAGPDWSDSVNASWVLVLDAVIGAMMNERVAPSARKAA